MLMPYLLAATTAAAAPNLLFITVDTLRADRCSIYGHKAPTTPMLERLAREGFQFDDAYAPMSQTSPSHATMFTGLYPITHGLSKNGIPLPAANRTLAEVLHDRAYQTGAVTSSRVFTKYSAFDQGFDSFDNDVDKDGVRVVEGIHGGVERLATRTTDLALAWIKARDAKKPFFLWAHYFSPHYPYAPPEAQRKVFAAGKDASALERLMGLYDGEVAYADQEIGRLLDGLDAAQLQGETLVVVTADHGEGVKQHGVLQHGPVLYEESVHVPLLFRWPGHVAAGKRNATPVELVDVMPTVLELLKVPDPPPAQGRSLRPILSGEAQGDPERMVYLQRREYSTFGGHVEGERYLDPGIHPIGPMFALRAGRFKYIEGPEQKVRELFDLERDPGETKNIAAENPEKAGEMSRALTQWREKYERGYKAPAIPKGEAERLRGLGYVH
jgi:choline-sulfatase